MKALTADFNPAARDDARDAAYPEKLKDVQQMVAGEKTPDIQMYANAMQFYDALMEFVNGVDAILRKDPKTPPTSIRGAALFEAMTTMPTFVGMQGKIVLDLYGLKEGFFAIRNNWGKTSVNVLLMDTWARVARDVFNPDTWVTDLSGNVKWKFQGNPVLFMGNTTKSPKNVVKGRCLPGFFFDPLKLGADPDADCPQCCNECEVGFFIEPGDTGKHDLTVCESCSPGYFADDRKSEQCKKCAKGTFSTSSQSTGIAKCDDCKPGFFQVEQNATFCSACAPGFFSPRDKFDTPCTSCDDLGDFYQEQAGKSECTPCPANSKRYPKKGKGSERTSCRCQEGSKPRRIGLCRLVPGPGADVAAVSPVPVQMSQG